MEELYECYQCGREGDEELFTTDVMADTPEDEMICERCYDRTNEENL